MYAINHIRTVGSDAACAGNATCRVLLLLQVSTTDIKYSI